MKLQLDTTNKIIKIEESVNLNEFIDLLKELLPDDKWKQFKLEAFSVINWNNPIIIEKQPPWPNPYQQPWISCDIGGTDTNEVNYRLNPGVFNIEK